MYACVESFILIENPFNLCDNLANQGKTVPFLWKPFQLCCVWTAYCDILSEFTMRVVILSYAWKPFQLCGTLYSMQKTFDMKPLHLHGNLSTYEI